MLRGPSIDALAALSGGVEGSRTLADAASLGEELLQATDVLRDQTALRRVLTDAIVEGDAKAGLVGDVFGRAFGERSVSLLQDAVRQRWTMSMDLPEALEQLGIVALVNSAGAKGSQISDELFSVSRLLDTEDGLRDALSDPVRSGADKAGLLEGLLGDRVLPATLRLVERAVGSGQGSVEHLLTAYQRLAAGAHGELAAVVRTARELSAGDQQRLADALGRHYDTTVHLHLVVDPDLVGGLRVEVGDDVIDGTVVTKLDDARRRIAG